MPNKYSVNIPLPENQHLKNIKTNLIKETSIDPVTHLQVSRLVEHPIYSGTDSQGNQILEMGGEPFWGLGCPAGCGRHWEFIADQTDIVEVLDSDGVTRQRQRGKTGYHFKPRDPAAFEGVNEDGMRNNGYLNFRSLPEMPYSVRIMTCDRCGAEIWLVRK
ncbi:MAG: hypothetical protein M1503_10115 [Thaumarchaeota archaeon]|nr:hypothetical protein [Nitrososphaerota archaeon]MCL5318596.1 hypothetical protein [Nitrososphaerota archaeon]